MPEKINLASFDIDVDQLVKATQDVKQRIDEIKKEQQELQKAGNGSTEAFINNAASLKSLNKEYGAQIKVLSDVSAATGKTIPLQQQLDSVMNREVRTISDLRKQNADLLKTRNNVNLETAEGQKQLQLINKRLDENDTKIKENVSAQEQQRLSVGGYTEGIKNAIGQTGLFGGAMTGVSGVMSAAQPIFNTVNVQINQIFNDLRNATAATQGMTTATEGMSRSQRLLTATTSAASAALKLFRLALISTGIGAIVVALGSLVAYLTSTQAGIDKINRVLVPLKTVFQALFGLFQQVGKALFDAFSNPKQVITDIYNFVKDQLIRQFEAFGKILRGLFTLDFDTMKEGFQDIGNQVRENANAIGGYFDKVGESINKAWEDGKRIQELQEAIEKGENNLVLLRATTEKQLKEQLNIAKDRAKNGEERSAAIREQERLAKNLVVEENKLLDLEIEQLKIKQAQNDTSREEEKQLLELQAQRIKNTERIDDIERKNLEVMNQLRNEQVAAAKKAQDEALKKQQEELDLFIAQQGIRARTLEQELELERQVSEKRKAIFQAELDAKKISQEKYQAEILKLNQDLLKRQAELTVDNARRELDALAERVEKERQAGTFLTEARLESLEEQQEQLAEAQAQHEELRFEQGLINEQEYQDALKQIAIDKDNSLAELRKERQEAQKEERALQMELEIEALEEQNASVFEIENLQIEQQRERDLEAAREKYRGTAQLANAELLVNQKADRQQAQLALERDNAILGARVQLLGAISKIVGEETALGKAVSIAQATINTYQGATMALASLPPPASFIAAGATIAQGLAQVANIAGINIGLGDNAAAGFGQIAQGAQLAFQPLPLEPGFATGGKINRGIPIHRSNGDNVIITAKKGEAVLNERQQAFLGRDLLGLAGVPGFATGGVVAAPASTTTVQNIITNQINAQLSETIGDAVQAGAQAGTFAGSRDGIVDLSNERNIALEANF